MGRLFRVWCPALLVIIFSAKITSYEKTLRKFVRNQSKMIPKPLNDYNEQILWRNTSNTLIRHSDALLFPGVAQMNRKFPNAHTLHRPRISTVVTSMRSSRNSMAHFNTKALKNIPLDERKNNMRRLNTLLRNNLTTSYNDDADFDFDADEKNMTIKNFYKIPLASRFFPSPEVQDVDNIPTTNRKDTIIIPDNLELRKRNATMPVMEPLVHKTRNKNSIDTLIIEDANMGKNGSSGDTELDPDKGVFFLDESTSDSQRLSYKVIIDQLTCVVTNEVKADIDVQEKFSQLDIEPTWMVNKQFWNNIFDSRYESLMRNPKWPPLKVVLVPRVHVDTIWTKSFEHYHKCCVKKILSNIVKKLQFYDRLTFSWNEVSHLSHWWKTAPHKTRSAVRKLVKSGRLEITTGGWVEPDEATTHLFGIVHQLIEGHQWLKVHLNYTPNVAWLTNSVTHSPTMVYLLSLADIHQVVLTNLHYAWEQYLAEYQYSDFIWLQNWDQDKTYPTNLNKDLLRMGNERYPKNAALTHYLQFNSDEFTACGPNSALCNKEYNFANFNKNLDISTYNIKERAELLLEQYSKTGTLSAHNTIIAPIGGPYSYQLQSEFDYQYNNYQKLADYVNVNREIYKATVEFGTADDYFSTIRHKYKQYPTLKGDFLNFADITAGSPAYWAGFYTSRPYVKILLRRLQSTLRTTELLFSFALNFNVFRRYNLSDDFELLLKARENVARLMDRNVVSGTVSANALKYVNNKIMATTRDCWHIQELCAGFLTMKSEQKSHSLQKYVYRDGEFVSAFRSIIPGDQIYIFNSLSHERTEIVEMVTRYSNIRLLDHNKKDVPIQINPSWKYSADNSIKISRKFFKVNFAVIVPALTFILYKIKETYDTSQNSATLYCLSCTVDDAESAHGKFPFNIHPIQAGDIQLESYKYRLIFDEYTGFLKTVVEKETSLEKTVFIVYGAFRDSDFKSGMFLFNTNDSHPLQDILTNYRLGSTSKIVFILSGQVTTELITVYGALLQHTTKIFNILNSPLSNAIYIESKVDYELSPKYRELEMFMSIQTDIANGNPPRIFIDNNSFQYTPRILNISRRIESNIYPMTSMSYIQDARSRLTFITDHAQGVTALQEGQIVVILDRRVLFNDGRGTEEGLADSGPTLHRHYILLENLIDQNYYNNQMIQDEIVLPSLNALYLANTLSYLLELYVIAEKSTDVSNYNTILPLVQTKFPCDVGLVNYRIILSRTKRESENNSLNSALMILHRQTFSCQINCLPLHCHGDSNFDLNKILHNIKSIYQTNLAGTTGGENIFNLNLVNFPPMELISLRVEF